MKEGEKDMYLIARQRHAAEKDMLGVRMIKAAEGNVITNRDCVLRMWKEYFEELMNVENEREKRVKQVASVT